MKSHRHANVERRKGPNKANRNTGYAALISWTLAFISLIIIYAAKPAYYWDRKQKMANPHSWDLGLAQWSFYTMVLCLFVCLAGIYISKNRTQRKADSYSANLIILAIISVISIIGYWCNF